MILKNVGTTFRAAVAILAISLFTIVSDATAEVFCGTSWTNACASVTVEVRSGSEFSQTDNDLWVLVISVMNVSLNPPGPLPVPFERDVESSVIRQLLFRITDGAGTLRTPTENFWVTYRENGTEVIWSGWELKRDGEFTMIGATFTQDVTNDDGSCLGIVADLSPDDPPAANLPCGPNGDFSTLAVFHLAFNAMPLELEDWAAQLVNMDASSCYEPQRESDDPFCESDWAVVPEPVTMVLVGTGLVGVGLMRRRRRRGLDIVED